MSTLGCECSRLDDLAVVDMGHHEDILSSLEEVRQRGAPMWWLYASTCRVCGQTWLVAQEERQNDIFILRRLDQATTRRLLDDGIWPPDFDRYETLLQIGKKAGRAVQFVDPATSSLVHTIGDLAQERPGIRVSELASLLNLDPSEAAKLARKVSGVITFDTD